MDSRLRHCMYAYVSKLQMDSGCCLSLLQEQPSDGVLTGLILSYICSVGDAIFHVNGANGEICDNQHT